MIEKGTIDQIFETVQIEDVVGDFVNLKKRGVNMLGLCPFHNEKTPSFTVSPTKGIYKCFGCGKGGNSVNFIMNHEHYTYPEALKYLAKKYNIEIEEKKLTNEQIEKSNQKESLFAISVFANDYFQNMLWKGNDSTALNYIKERGYTEKIITDFQLGYSLKEKKAFSNYALKSSFDQKVLEDSGLSIIEKNSIKDRFRNRIIFPIHSFSGRILGFGGRSLGSYNKAKYINSPETLIYQKSKVLYGMFFAKQSISKLDNCFIVEGYTDVISLYANGVKNAVSSSGTSLTTDQIKLIRRFTKNITILFDGDVAGIKASFRSIDMILSEGMNVKIVFFPDGEDPDSYSRKISSEELRIFLKDEAKDFISFKIQILNPESELDPAKRAEIIRDIIASISVIPDYLTRTEYCKMCSKLLGKSEKDILLIMDQQRKKRANSKNTSRSLNEKKDPELIKKASRLEKLELEVLRILFNYGNERLVFANDEVSVASFIIEELEIDKINFTNTDHISIYELIKKFVDKNKYLDINFFIDHQDTSLSAICVDLISVEHNISLNWQKRHKIFTGRESDKLKKTTIKAVLSLKLKHLENNIKKIQDQLRISSANKKDVEILKNLIDIKKKIADNMGRGVI